MQASGFLQPFVILEGTGKIAGGITLHHYDEQRSRVEVGYWLLPGGPRPRHRVARRPHARRPRARQRRAAARSGRPPGERALDPRARTARLHARGTAALVPALRAAAAPTRSSTRCSRANEDARRLPDGDARDARARAGGRRGRRRRDRARLPVLRSARRRPSDPPRRRALARGRDAHRALPRGAGRDPRAGRRAADPDDLRVDLRRLRLGAARDRTRARPARRRSSSRTCRATSSPGCAACSSSRRRRPTRACVSPRTRPTAGCISSPSPARPARAPSSVRRSLRSPRVRARATHAPAARGLRHLDAGAGARGRRARRRHRRRLARRRGRRAGAGASSARLVALAARGARRRWRPPA